MRTRANRPARRGAATTEAALVLPVFLTLVLGAIDVSVGVARYNSLSQAARHGARQAMVHGSKAPSEWNGGPWGPGPVDQPASAAGVPAVDADRPLLALCPLDESRVRVEWLDGSNEPGKPVRVTVTSTYRPMLTFLFGNPAIAITASSTMPIAH
ncbi:MAG TPA: TadE/TadG family type IV pilus assembly protein [Gemmataceae bacterium]|nr:TadE/TadG family type IV pilus assembly protein [Gemmataceae bacterium]